MKRAVAHQLRVVRLDDSRSLDVIHGKPTYVGRGVLGMTEPRLSRKQLLIRFDALTGHAVALTQGVPNPSFVKDEDSTDWVRMEDGREYELHHHTMLKPLVIGPELLVELTSDAAAPATATAVRDGPVGAPAKRAKQLLPCQFGAECYRTNNAEHSAKYSHPHVNDLNQNRATAQLAVDAAAIGADATAPRPTSAAAAAAGAAAVARAAPPPVGGEQPVRGADGGAKGGGGGGWSNALLPFCQRPEAHPDEVVRHTATAVAIRDKYPKARVHFLVMPRARIDNFAALTAAHLPLLRELHEMGLALAAESGVKCRLGYHMRPSMTQIHLHVISDDMDSACLKNKKHWNSFCTEFFVPSAVVMGMLEDEGRVWFDSEKAADLLAMDMRCHRCKQPLSNLPAVKAHVLKCRG